MEEQQDMAGLLRGILLGTAGLEKWAADDAIQAAWEEWESRLRAHFGMAESFRLFAAEDGYIGWVP